MFRKKIGVERQALPVIPPKAEGKLESRTSPPDQKAILESIYFNLISFHNSKEALSFLSTNRKFKSLDANKKTWIYLYKEHFGELYFDEDHKDQFIAAFLEKNATDYADYLKLLTHIQKFSGKDWTYYYRAILAKNSCFIEVKSSGVTPVGESKYGEEEKKESKEPVKEAELPPTDSRDPRALALFALKKGDKRGALFLVKELLCVYSWHDSIQDEWIDQALDVLHANTLSFAAELSMLYSLKYVSSPPESKPFYQELALDFYFRSVEMDIKQFNFFCFRNICNLLKLLSLETIKRIAEDDHILAQLNGIEGLVYLVDHHMLPSRQRMYAGIKSIADSGNAAAAYHYAEEALHKELYTEAKQYFLQAIQNGEYRAASAIQHFSKKHRNIISREEVIALLTPLASPHKMDCIYALATEFLLSKNWHTHLFQIWVIQLSVSNPVFESKAVMSKMSSKATLPEGAYVRCALVCVALFRDKNKEKAYTLLEEIMTIDTEIFPTYCAAGKKWKLSLTEHEESIAELLKLYKERNASYSHKVKP